MNAHKGVVTGQKLLAPTASAPLSLRFNVADYRNINVSCYSLAIAWLSVSALELEMGYDCQ